MKDRDSHSSFRSSDALILVNLQKALTGATKILRTNPVFVQSLQSNVKIANLQTAAENAQESLSASAAAVDNGLSKFRSVNPRDAEVYTQRTNELLSKVRKMQDTLDEVIVALAAASIEVRKNYAVILGQINESPNQDEITKSGTIHRKLAELQDLVGPLSTKSVNTLDTVEKLVGELTGIYVNVLDRLPISIKANLPAVHQLDAAAASMTTPRAGG